MSTILWHDKSIIVTSVNNTTDFSLPPTYSCYSMWKRGCHVCKEWRRLYEGQSEVIQWKLDLFCGWHWLTLLMTNYEELCSPRPWSAARVSEAGVCTRLMSPCCPLRSSALRTHMYLLLPVTVLSVSGPHCHEYQTQDMDFSHILSLTSSHLLHKVLLIALFEQKIR